MEKPIAMNSSRVFEIHSASPSLSEPQGFVNQVGQVKDAIRGHPFQLIVTLVALLIGIIVARAIANRYTHLAEYPGPSWAAYTRLWLSKTIASGDSARLFVDINKKHGPIARIGPNHLLTDDPELTRRVLAARSHYTRGPWFDAIRIDPHVPNIVSERDPGKHNHLRYQMSAGYAGREIEGLEAAVCERMNEFIGRIDREYVTEPGESRKVVDIARRIQFLAVDVITHLCFGKPLGFVQNNKDMFSFLQTIEQQLPIVQHFSVVLELNTIIRKIVDVPWLKPYIAPSARDTKGIGVIMGVSKGSKPVEGAPTTLIRLDAKLRSTDLPWCHRRALRPGRHDPQRHARLLQEAWPHSRRGRNRNLHLPVRTKVPNPASASLPPSP